MAIEAQTAETAQTDVQVVVVEAGAGTGAVEEKNPHFEAKPIQETSPFPNLPGVGLGENTPEWVAFHQNTNPFAPGYKIPGYLQPAQVVVATAESTDVDNAENLIELPKAPANPVVGAGATTQSATTPAVVIAGEGDRVGTQQAAAVSSVEVIAEVASTPVEEPGAWQALVAQASLPENANADAGVDVGVEPETGVGQITGPLDNQNLNERAR